MSIYKKSNDTKNKLFSCAKNLFYEKGYYKTSIDDISQMANMNRALISYYYGSKANLALELVKQLNESVSKEMLIQLEGNSKIINPFIMLALEFRVYTSLRRRNDYYKRFIKELCLENILQMGYINKQNFDYLQQEYHIKISDVDKQIAKKSIDSVIRGLIISHSDGEIDCSHEYMAEKESEIVLKLLGIDNNTIYDILQKSKLIFQNLDIKIEENFVIT